MKKNPPKISENQPNLIAHRRKLRDRILYPSNLPAKVIQAKVCIRREAKYTHEEQKIFFFFWLTFLMSKLYVLEAIENYAEHGKTNFVFSLFFVVIVFRKILDSILLLSSRMHLVQWLLFLSLFWLFFFFHKEDRSKKK